MKNLSSPKYCGSQNGEDEVGREEYLKVLGSCTNASIPPSSKDVVSLRCAIDITPRSVEWLWPGWLACGKLHILAGAPGTGKTNIALALMAAVSTGADWPDGKIGGEPRDVIMWSGEDGIDDTLVPRLVAAGADRTRVHIISAVNNGNKRRPFDPSKDLKLLIPGLEGLHLGLLVIDSIVSAVSGDGHKNTETRRDLQQIVDLADQFDMAVIGITHLTKGTANRNPLERVTGSLAFGALARVVLMTAKLPKENPYGTERILVRAKSNLGNDSGGIGYSLASVEVPPDVEAVRVNWGKYIDGEAQDLLVETTGSSQNQGALNEAKAFLLATLEDGPVPSVEIIEMARSSGISERTLKRAKSDAGVIADKDGLKGWVWCLP